MTAYFFAGYDSANPPTPDQDWYQVDARAGPTHVSITSCRTTCGCSTRSTTRIRARPDRRRRRERGRRARRRLHSVGRGLPDRDLGLQFVAGSVAGRGVVPPDSFTRPYMIDRRHSREIDGKLPVVTGPEHQPLGACGADRRSGDLVPGYAVGEYRIEGPLGRAGSARCTRAPPADRQAGRDQGAGAHRSSDPRDGRGSSPRRARSTRSATATSSTSSRSAKLARRPAATT